MILTTDEILEEYRSADGVRRRMTSKNYYGGYIYPIGVDETHTDDNGDRWYIITAFTYDIDYWLLEQCESNFEFCGHACAHERWDRYPRYNIHESLLFYIKLKWT